MPAADLSSENAPPVCPTCAMTMRLISMAPNCHGVVYGYLCSNDGGRLSWQPGSRKAASLDFHGTELT
jgi:hypothetical protein